MSRKKTPTSPLYDKYYVLKIEHFQDLFFAIIREFLPTLLRIMTDSLVYFCSGRQLPDTILKRFRVEFERIIARMHKEQGNRYFCLNLDEDEAEAAVRAYWDAKGFNGEKIDTLMGRLHCKWVGKWIVFRHKTLTTGEIIEEWAHPDDNEAVFKIRDKQGNIYTNVPIRWKVKELRGEALKAYLKPEEEGEG